MTYIQAFIMAFVEGITEFLPISSTAHLVITAKLLGLSQTRFVEFFEIFVQFGAILAILVIYTKKILSNKSLILKLIASFIPTAIIGLLLHKLFKDYLLGNLLVISIALIAVGALFILIERFDKNNIKTISELSLKQAVLIGVIQALAIIPGVSRSGAVILGMLFLGFNRKDSAEYSFLLGLPTLSAAAFYDAYKTQAWTLPASDLGVLFFATVVAFVFAILAVFWFIKYLKHNSLEPFGWYRIALGIVLLLFLV